MEQLCENCMNKNFFHTHIVTCQVWIENIKIGLLELSLLFLISHVYVYISQCIHTCDVHFSDENWWNAFLENIHSNRLIVNELVTIELITHTIVHTPIRTYHICLSLTSFQKKKKIKKEKFYVISLHDSD